MKKENEISKLYSFEDMDFLYWENYFNPSQLMGLEHRRGKIKEALKHILSIYDNAVKRGYYGDEK